MSCFRIFCIALLASVLVASFHVPAFADASEAAAVPAGGIQFKKGKNISMEREDLFISLDKIEATLVFKNHSHKNITTLVAFPVPEYYLDPTGHSAKFEDFSVNINGKKIKHQIDKRAVLKGKDVTDVLERMDIPWEDDNYNADDLNERDRIKLEKLGILTSLGYPLWDISKKYYWKQTFPANGQVTMKFSYTPHYGWDSNYNEGDEFPNNPTKVYKDACLDSAALQWLKKHNHPAVQEVDYILTTAKNWQGPIKNFHLIIEKPSEKGIMSLCWNYEIKKTGPKRFESFVKDFVPDKDITVYFFQ